MQPAMNSLGMLGQTPGGSWKLHSCGSSPEPRYPLSSSHSCLFEVFAFFSGLELVFLSTRDPIPSTHILILRDHPGVQVIQATPGFGKKTALEVMLHNSRPGFFIERRGWCWAYVERNRFQILAGHYKPDVNLDLNWSCYFNDISPCPLFLPGPQSV